MLRGATYANTPRDTLEGCVLPVAAIKVNDGDTLWVAALTRTACCMLPRREGMHIRLRGYDSPELHPKTAKTEPAYAQEVYAAQQAKLFLEQLIANKALTARLYKRDKYGRRLADLFYNGVCVNDAMLAAGHGVPYAGGTKAAFRPRL